MAVQKQSWIHRNHNIFQHFTFLRDVILKKIYIIGDKLANTLINIGYLIKASSFFRKALVKTEISREHVYDKISYDYNLNREEIVYLEFGVYQGKSFKYWLEKNHNPNSSFFGFDTFSGLPEDWGHIPKGHFDTKGRIPRYDDSRYEFYKGLFQDTLPSFLISKGSLLIKRLLINLDSDLYSSTLYTLSRLEAYLKPGDILIFDEFFSIVNASSEFRAFLDFQSITRLKFKVVSKTTTHCVMIIDLAQ